MKNVLLGILLFCANITFSQDVFTNENIGFSIQHPPTWIKAKDGEEIENLKNQIKLDKKELQKLLEQNKGSIQVVSFYKYAADLTFGMVPTIKVNLKTNEHKTFVDFKKSIIDSFIGIQNTFPDFKYTIKPKETVVARKQCITAAFTYIVKGKEGNSKVKTILYAIPVNDKYYQITLIDTESDNSNTELFEKIIKTVVIK